MRTAGSESLESSQSAKPQVELGPPAASVLGGELHSTSSLPCPRHHFPRYARSSRWKCIADHLRYPDTARKGSELVARPEAVRLTGSRGRGTARITSSHYGRIEEYFRNCRCLHAPALLCGFLIGKDSLLRPLAGRRFLSAAAPTRSGGDVQKSTFPVGAWSVHGSI